MVILKEDNLKKEVPEEELTEIEARREKFCRNKKAREMKMKIGSGDLFQISPEYDGKYGTLDETMGVPTHIANDRPLTQSAMKKLKKD